MDSNFGAYPLDPQSSGALLEAAGTSAFAPMFLKAAQCIAPIDEVFAYRMPFSGRPEPLISSSVLGDAKHRAESYSRRFHRYDPAAKARDALAVGQGFAHQIRSEEILDRDYRDICFERPRFAAKSCFAWRTANHSFVISFYHRKDQGDAKMDRLGTLANIGLTALVRRSAPLPVSTRIENRLGSLFPQLSPRERQVCALTIAGKTADEIAADLGIRRSSVLTYRQRAYQRLDFSSAADFLDGLLG